MFGSIVAQILAIMATTTGGVLVALAYHHHRQQALRFWEREKRLPEATKYGHLSSLVEQEENALGELRDQLYDAKQVIEEAERRQQWMKETQDEIAGLQADREEVERIHRELETRQLELASANEQKAAREQDIASLQQELKSLEQQVEQLKGLVEEIDQLRESIQIKRQELEQSNQQLITLQSDVRTLLNETNRLKSERADLEEQIEKLQESCEQHQSKLQDLLQERNRVEREVHGLEKRLSGLESQIPDLKELVSNLSAQLPAGAKRDGQLNVDLWQPVFRSLKKTSQGHSSEVEALQRLHENLTRNGLYFHRRTINAFHTSLKTTLSSPLVVLAGVSGTGKSELPRRYAEAMGIHFLNLAVQPRWDSPQDLFGFYDYLEQRFRPTELTRSLIQMDRFSGEENRGWDADPETLRKINRSGEMALVLLDEMNLARVEYYFSEFLSRLETRRGINPRDSEERRKAEIVLDMGGRDGAPPFRIFVDSNVLFVGTMNEDETTQALSDKVIDRANVLRFGSPADVSGCSSQASNGRPPHALGRLKFATWNKQWVKSPDSLDRESADKLNHCIKELRTAMDEVQRPFAYRVSKAMLEYAANYPDPSNHFGEIISDQIEQKILPRLRGIDPTDGAGVRAFARIEEILRRDCQDELLIEHLNRCKRDNYFQWIGLDRARDDLTDA
ncbi:AAA family ATPase [Lignipirellula cremea]|uniref:Chromosome segregation protein n=1 Tax=Lignipirellula cremea TaxID=2528010 RepID=A0A518DWP8_9BACT|nr:AAA family ATPase [Lignipirellula cremea]QDU96265.1 chromosome segregation protein [Lignipirellula cremea]